METNPPPSNRYRTLAVRVLMAGFSRLNDLDGLCTQEVESLGIDTWERAFLARVLSKVKVAEMRKRVSWAEGVLNQTTETLPMDASEFVDALTPLKAESAWSQLVQKLDITAAAEGVGPTKAVCNLMRLKNEGVDVMAQLDQKALLGRLAHLSPSSIPALCSGVRCWHYFACGILGYLPEVTLPPKRSLDIERFIAMFKCGPTGANYVYHIRNACRILRLAVCWFDENVAMQISGVKKQRQRDLHLRVEDRAIFQRVHVNKNVAFNDYIGQQDKSVLVLMCWEFLFRVQSEALPLECGRAEELLLLPPERHSAVWVANSVCFVRLRRRKHRPKGSILKRACCCQHVGRQFCACCRVQKYIEGFTTGTKLWDISHGAFLKLFRSQLQIVGYVRFAEVTLRSFRSSMATQLLRDGKCIEAVLAAGEWQGATIMSYLKTRDIDESEILKQAVAVSDDEA